MLDPMAAGDEPDRQKVNAKTIEAPHATRKATNNICVVVTPPRDDRVKASDIAATVSATCATIPDVFLVNVPINDGLFMVSPVR